MWQGLLKLSISLLYDPTILLSGVYTQQKAAYMFTKVMCRNVDRGHKWKQVTCPLLLKWQFVVYLYNKIRYNNKNEQATATYNHTNESHRYKLKQQKEIIKEYIVNDFSYSEIQKTQN